LATIHANAPREALFRLETLALLASEIIKENAIRSLVAGSIHAIVQLERTAKGRKLTRIAELKGVDCGNYLLKEQTFS
jgi:pilus assembly protein CpaF